MLYCGAAESHHGGLVKTPLGREGTSGVSGMPDKTTGRATSDNRVPTVDALARVSFGERTTQKRTESVLFQKS